ncbi:hypothetical protein [Sphingobacterium sp. ML3W]|uniref:hypothetical protein n=1 Tax=Sphingobacterium sp. ML3W TaxID=1538644 RepID=UPI000690BAD0|nr:hypothetical protein [Sphingobacterium sp. ML3W]
METRKIECSLHGKQEIGLLCTQLAHSLLNQIKVGFHEFDNADLGRPDAWCDACNEQLKSVKTDKEQEEWFLNKWMPMHLTFPNLE